MAKTKTQAVILNLKIVLRYKIQKNPQNINYCKNNSKLLNTKNNTKQKLNKNKQSKMKSKPKIFI